MLSAVRVTFGWALSERRYSRLEHAVPSASIEDGIDAPGDRELDANVDTSCLNQPGVYLSGVHARLTVSCGY